MPRVICRGQLVLRNPTNQEIADCLGFNESIDQTHVRDLIIIGAGPSRTGRPRCMAHQKGLTLWSWKRVLRVARLVQAQE